MDPDDYDRIEKGDTVNIPGLRTALLAGSDTVSIEVGKDRTIQAHLEVSERDRLILASGGLLNWAKARIGAGRT